MVVEAFKTVGSILNKSTQNKSERTELPSFQMTNCYLTKIKSSLRACDDSRKFK